LDGLPRGFDICSGNSSSLPTISFFTIPQHPWSQSPRHAKHRSPAHERNAIGHTLVPASSVLQIFTI
jgi:hypothetical protein